MIQSRRASSQCCAGRSDRDVERPVKRRAGEGRGSGGEAGGERGKGEGRERPVKRPSVQSVSWESNASSERPVSQLGVKRSLAGSCSWSSQKHPTGAFSTSKRRRAAKWFVQPLGLWNKWDRATCATSGTVQQVGPAKLVVHPRFSHRATGPLRRVSHQCRRSRSACGQPKIHTLAATGLGSAPI